MKGLVSNLILQPRKVLIIDGFGAALTATMLLAILKWLNQYFLIPDAMLTVLAKIALVFAIYSLTCSVFAKQEPAKFLLPIALANIAYCILTAGLVIYHFNNVTPFAKLSCPCRCSPAAPPLLCLVTNNRSAGHECCLH